MLRMFFVLTLVVAATACSGSSPAAPSPAPATTPGATTTPAGSPTITITSAGMSPLDLTIAVGQRVTFVNNDTRAHDVVGGKDPSTPDCPEIAQAGFLTPGQRGETGVFTRTHTCEYHDHTMMGVPAFQGRIVIR